MRDEAHALAGRDGNLALVRAQLARQNTEERRLSAAVVAENADALPLGDGEAEPVENVPADLKGFY